MNRSRFFIGFAHATSALGVLLFLVCVVAWGVTAAGIADVQPPLKMWQSAGGLIIAGMALRWLLGQSSNTGQEKN